MKPFQCFADIDGLSTRLDGAVKIVLSTQELNPEAVASLFELRGKSSYVAFVGAVPAKVEDIEIPESEPEFPNEKSPSQRLRNVLFILWEQTKPPQDFEIFRRAKMEALIEYFKKQIPNENQQ